MIKGNGILILVFGIAGFAAGMIAGNFAPASFSQSKFLPYAAGCWGAALFVWLYASSLGRTTQVSHVDELSGRRELKDRPHTFLFMGGRTWTGLLGLAAAALTAGLFLAPEKLDSLANTARDQVADAASKLSIPLPEALQKPKPVEPVTPPAPPKPKINAASLLLPSPVQDWKGTDGRVLNGELMRFVGADGSGAEFRRSSDGQLFVMQTNTFDAETQQRVKALYEQYRAANP